MISKVGAENFKGLTFETELERHTIFIGENGAGKSARTQALQLAINGYIPGTEKNIKKNDEILTQYCTGDDMQVWCNNNGTLFGRRFVRNNKGSVRQEYLVNGRKVKADEFMKTMGESGFPIIVDLNELFISASDSKKIDVMFRLYPPEGNLDTLDRSIDAKKAKINSLESEMVDDANVAQRLSISRAEITLPSGTLAETKAAIEQSNKDLDTAQEDLKKLQIKEAEKAAAEAEKARAEAEARVQKQLKEQEEREARDAKAELVPELEVSPEKFMEQLDKAPVKAAIEGGQGIEQEPDDIPEPEIPKDLEPESVGIGKFPPPTQEGALIYDVSKPGPVIFMQEHMQEPVITYPVIHESPAPHAEKALAYLVILKKVLQKMDQAGCDVCAARLTLISEMKELGES